MHLIVPHEILADLDSEMNVEYLYLLGSHE